VKLFNKGVPVILIQLLHNVSSLASLCLTSHVSDLLRGYAVHFYC